MNYHAYFIIPKLLTQVITVSYMFSVVHNSIQKLLNYLNLDIK